VHGHGVFGGFEADVRQPWAGDLLRIAVQNGYRCSEATANPRKQCEILAERTGFERRSLIDHTQGTDFP
jgi:hypothetical protein